MRELKRSNKPNGRIMSKAILVSIVLAVVGVMSAIYLYQYTYANKLEVELNNKQSELQTKSKDIEQKASELNLSESQKLELQRQVDELNKQKEELNKQLQAKAEKARVASVQAAQAASVPKVVSYTTPTPQASSGGCEGLRNKLSSLGVSGANLDAAITLAKRESSCNEYSVNKSSGACGAFQSLPCGKWGAPGTDQYYLGAINYANSRYGSYSAALSFSYANNWY